MTIPEEIRDFETYIVAYSGGKDSTATVLWSLEHLPREKLRFVFCNTGAEWPETYEYLGYVERELGITVERIRAGDREIPPKRDKSSRPLESNARNFWHLCHLRGSWPTAAARSCTTYLKFIPLRLYSYDYRQPVMIEGTRSEESESRSKLDQYGGSNGRTPIYRPILNWSECQVWDYLRVHHILPNPVYNYATRCGCWCCIMGRDDEVLNFCRLHPDIAQQAADLEEEIGHTWKHGQSIGNLLQQAQAQMLLFEPQPRFEAVGAP